LNKKLRILHLEDNASDAELITYELHNTGLDFDYLCVKSGEDFYRAVREFTPAIILCDYSLPHFDGMSALKFVRNETPEIPVIMVTGALTDTKAVELLKAGAKDYILKNALERLPSAITRVLQEEEMIRARKQAEDALLQSAQQLLRSLEGIVQAMAMVVEIRDPYTAGHQRKVSLLSKAIAEEMQLPFEETHGIMLAAEIHDLGKIRVPAEILAKPGKLEHTEFELLKSHPTVGYEILKDIEFPWPIAEIVHQHHEHEDGSGYPNGLKAGEILLGAKIIAVADVVEAITSHRPYRAALGIEFAISEIKSNRGVLYNEAVVDACLNVLIKSNYQLM